MKKRVKNPGGSEVSVTRGAVWLKLLVGVATVAASGMLLGAGSHPVAAVLFLASGLLFGTVALVDATRARRRRARRRDRSVVQPAIVAERPATRVIIPDDASFG